jgi:hypothetical protein
VAGGRPRARESTAFLPGKPCREPWLYGNPTRMVFRQAPAGTFPPSPPAPRRRPRRRAFAGAWGAQERVLGLAPSSLERVLRRPAASNRAGSWQRKPSVRPYPLGDDDHRQSRYEQHGQPSPCHPG